MRPYERLARAYACVGLPDANKPRRALTNNRYVRYNRPVVDVPETAADIEFRPPSNLIDDNMNEADNNPSPDSQRLDHFVKIVAEAGTGGQAKLLIQGGEVRVNGEVETRRRRKLMPGDIVEFSGKRHTVT